MSEFTKTKIVDVDGGGDFTTIREATNYFITNEIGGVIIVESGEYEIDGTNNEQDKRRVEIPSNMTLIGRGNVVVRVTNLSQSAFINYNQGSGDTNITLTGFKIVVACENNPYRSHLIFLQNVSNCRLEKLYIKDESTYGVYRVPPEEYVAIYIYSNGHDCKNNIITQCTIKNFGTVDEGTGDLNFGSGIGFNTANPATGICCDNVIKNNFAFYCMTNFFSYFSERDKINGNIFCKAKILNMNLNQCKNFIIRGNQLNETDEVTGGHGLYPSGCEGMVIAGNIVSKNGQSGIKPRFGGTAENPVADKYYSITGNVCNENGRNLPEGGHGIFLQEYSERMTICGNVCANNNNDGIRLFKNTETGVSVYNNLVVGNVAVLKEFNPNNAPISIEHPSNSKADNIEENRENE